jgi:hypothetical protein
VKFPAPSPSSTETELLPECHGVFDFVRHFFIDNPGVPQWWPGFTDPVGMIWNFSPLITGVALLMAFSRRRLPSLPAPVD